ncbi:MAG: efflux RND transporter periplasmic adaptor subunit [Clostridia bacterium]
MKKKGIAIAAALFITAAAVGWMFYDAGERQRIRVRVEKVQHRDITTMIETSGIVEPSRLMNITAETGGKVSRVYVKEGQQVKKGESLVSLDPGVLKRQLEQAELSLEIEKKLAAKVREETAQQRAETALAMAQSIGMDYDRFTRAMEEYRMVSGDGEELAAVWASDDRPLEDKNIQAMKLELAEMELRNLRMELEKYTLKATMEGEVLAVNAKEGEFAPPGVPAIVIGDTRQMAVQATISENDILRVKVGQEVEISGDTVGPVPVKGRIVGIKPMAKRLEAGQAMEAVGQVIIEPERGKLQTLPGVSVNVNIICQSKKKALAVPIEAILQRDEEEYVYILEEDRAYLRKVRTGVQNDFYVEITEGLAPGDRIVFDPSRNIYNGARVRAVD